MNVVVGVGLGDGAWIWPKCSYDGIHFGATLADKVICLQCYYRRKADGLLQALHPFQFVFFGGSWHSIHWMFTLNNLWNGQKQTEKRTIIKKFISSNRKQHFFSSQKIDSRHTRPSESVLHALMISAPPHAYSSKQCDLLRSWISRTWTIK